MFCFSNLFIHADSAVKHPITFKNLPKKKLHLQPTQTIAHQCILVHKYNKKQLLFKKNIKNIQNFQKTFNKAEKKIH